MGRQTYRQPPIVIAGFPYAFSYYFQTLEYLSSAPSNYIFALPRFWKAKGGKIRIPLSRRPGWHIFGLRAASFGGRSFLCGALKGWMPGLAGLLPWVRIRYHSRVLYLCSEPHLIATLISATIARLCAMRIVLFTWQNVRPDVRMRGCKLWLSNMLVRCNLGLAHGIICGNRKAEAIVHDFVPHMPTVVCPLAGVDTKRFMPDGPNQRELLVSAAGTKLILFAGALDERKGLDTLIRAIARLEQRDAKLVIVGTGPFRANLEKLAYELGITDRVIFRDWVRNEDLPQIMHSANVFAYPSVPRGGWEEQFGYAMAEASACGVPVVATRTGSIDEVVIHERTGLLVEPNNSEALARALDSILQDTEYAHQLGNAGRAYVAEHFSHQAIAHRIERFLASFQ